MKTITRSPGLRVQLPDALTLSAAATPSDPTRGFMRPTGGTIPMASPAGGAPADSELAAISRALGRTDIALVDTLQIEPQPVAPGQMRAAPLAEGHVVRTEVDLAPEESVAVLVEQDGFYAWNFETDGGTGGDATPRSRGPQSGRRTAVLEIRLGATKRTGAAQRGFLTDLIVERAQLLVFKFAGRFLLGRLGDYLEKEIRPGIIRMDRDDPLAWAALTPLEKLPLPPHRRARVLLFVHGTFSSTKGGYGALGATPWGRAFLQSARASYDAVIGYEHATLTVDPLANARELERFLEAHVGAQETSFDVICHSRGGIVTRSLLEHVRPGERRPWKFERVVFVGAVNGGTELANPSNWRTLIDLYTNLAAAACRAIALFPGAAPASTLISEVIGSLGSLVKVLAAEAINAGALPGLAAMEPSGKFIQELNRAQPNQPTPENSLYYAITSEFNVGLAHRADGKLPKQVLLLLADGFMDRLIGKANDLVVNVDSMTAIDVEVGAFVKDSLAFASNGTVYHTNYFLQPEVTNALARWLELASPEVPVARGVRGLLDAGSIARALPARVDPNIAIVGAGELGLEVCDLLQKSAPSYVVVERFERPGKPMRYAFPTEFVLEHAMHRPQVTLRDSLNLHETDVSPQANAFAMPVVSPAAGTAPSVSRIIATEGGEIVGVAEGVVAAKSLATLVGHAKQVSAFATPQDRIVARRSLPAFRALSTGNLKRMAGSARTMEVIETSMFGERPAAGGGGGTAYMPAKSMPPGTGAGEGAGVPPRSAPGGWRARSMPSMPAAMPEAAPPAPAPRTTRGERSMPPVPPAAPAPSSMPMPAPAAGPAREAPAETAAAAPRGGDIAGDTTPPGTIACHVRAEMDDEVVLGETATVDVIMSRDVITEALREMSVAGVGVVREDVPLVVELIPAKNFTVAGRSRFELPPPPAGTPKTCSFDVEPTNAGEGMVIVRVRQGGLPFVNLRLHCTIVAQRTRAVARRPEESTVLEPAGTQPMHQLTIFEIERGGQKLYQFIIDSPTFGWKHSYESKPIVGDRDAYVRGLYDDIEKRWLESAKDFDEFQRELRDLGANLWDELVPAEVQRALWDHRHDIHEILVFSEEPFIPWEIVHLKEPGKGLGPETLFLAQLGVVRWLHNIGWPTETLRARTGRCFYVIPRYLHPDWVLPQAELEAGFLETTFDADRVPAHPADVRALFEAEGRFDLLHFACHGVADQKDIGRAELMLEGRPSDDGRQMVVERLRPSAIENGASLVGADGTKPIVVLNACQVGRQGYSLTSIGGFSRAFLRKGAGMFIAASWAVGDRPARSFTEKVYERLKAGDTLAEASVAARSTARAAREATWLAYTVYGNPHARLR